MAGSDRQLTLDLLARDKTGPATKSAADNLDDVADAAVVAGKATDRLGSASDRASGRVKGLDRSIATVKQNLVFLHQAMGDAADEAERFDISKGIRKAEAELRRLTKSRDVLKDLQPKVDKNFGAKFAASITEGMAGVSTKLGASVGPTVGVAIAAAAAPVLLTTLGTALAAGAAGGVLGVGIIAAVKSDQKIKDAGAQAGGLFMSGLQNAAQKALSGRTLGVIADLSAAGDRLTDKLGTAFSKLGPYVRPFTRDVTAAGEAIANRLIAEAGNAGPALAGLGDSIHLIGDGFADFVGLVADGGPEMASNLKLIAGGTADMLRQTGFMINAFNELANNPWITGPLIPLLRKHYEGVADGQKDVGDSAVGAAAGIKQVGMVAAEAAPPLKTAADSLKDIANSYQSLFDATTRAAKAVDDVNVAFKENGKTLATNTAAGRENREALSNLATAYNATYENSLKVNGQGPATDAIARNNAANFVILARRLGASKKEAIELANKMLAIPDVQRYVKVIGVSAAVAAANRIKDTLAAIKSRTVRVNVITSSGKNSSELRHAYEKNAREYGGPVKAGHAYVVGEKRAEVFVPDRDGKIVPSLEKYARSSGSAGSGGWAASAAAPRSVAVTVRGGSGVNDLLYELVNYGIRTGAIVVSVT